MFALGTNGAASDEQLNELIAAAGPDRQVFFVNTRSPQSWVGQTNGAMFDAADRHDNVHVIDWYTASADHDEYFDGATIARTPGRIISCKAAAVEISTHLR